MSPRRWITRGYVSALLPLSEEQIRAVERRCGRNLHASNRALMWAAILLLPVAVIGGGAVLSSGLGQFATRPVAWPIGFLGACALAVFIFLKVIFRLHAPAMRRSLRVEGFEICVQCGYWLRDLDERAMKCPECGARRTPMMRQQMTDDSTAPPTSTSQNSN